MRTGAADDPRPLHFGDRRGRRRDRLRLPHPRPGAAGGRLGGEGPRRYGRRADLRPGRPLRRAARRDVARRRAPAPRDRRRDDRHAAAHPRGALPRGDRGRPPRAVREAVRRRRHRGARRARGGRARRGRPPPRQRVPLGDRPGPARQDREERCDRRAPPRLVPARDPAARHGGRRGPDVVGRRGEGRRVARCARLARDRPDPLDARRVRVGERDAAVAGRARLERRGHLLGALPPALGRCPGWHRAARPTGARSCS